MKKMSKIVHVVLALAVLVFCLTACVGQEKDMPSEENATEISAPSNEEPQAPKDEIDEAKTEQGDLADKVEEEEGDTKMPEANNVNSADNEAISAVGVGGSRVLVAYFSATGTTKRLAEYAAEVMGADLYEIVPEEPYTDADLNYNDKNSRTSIEMNDKSIRPAISGSVADMDQYGIVFMGYPIWWGNAPHIMDTFMESYDFSGKTIVPFCTSGSSGISSSAQNLHDHTDSSVTWLDGARLKSNSSKEDMADWIRGLSLGIDVK